MGFTKEVLKVGQPGMLPRKGQSVTVHCTGKQHKREEQPALRGSAAATWRPLHLLAALRVC